jgi:hypothetical protein
MRPAVPCSACTTQLIRGPVVASIVRSALLTEYGYSPYGDTTVPTFQLLRLRGAYHLDSSQLCSLLRLAIEKGQREASPEVSPGESNPQWLYSGHVGGFCC